MRMCQSSRRRRTKSQSTLKTHSCRHHSEQSARPAAKVVISVREVGVNKEGKCGRRGTAFCCWRYYGSV